MSLSQRPFSYAGRLSGASDQWTLAGEAQLGDAAIKQSFTGSVAGAPPRLSGELSLALLGLELTARGTVADLSKGHGLDLHVAGRAADIAPLARLLGHEVPSGRMAAKATLGGDVDGATDKRSAPQP